jgi:Type II secretion system (T2SS), protein E, N-terminal domain
VSDEAIALAFRTGLPYVGLRDHEHDPELDHLVPPDAARSARVLPLTAADDHVRLAVADPEPDLAALTPYLEGRRVELAIAPREELEEILGPPPDEVEVPVAEAAAVEAEAEAEAPAVAEPEPLTPPEPPQPEQLEPEPLEAEQPEAAPATTEGLEEEAPAAEPEPPAAAEPEPEPLAAAEPEPEPEPPSPAEPEPPVVEHYAFAPAEAPGETPSWLAPPPKRRWLRAIGRFLLYVLVLAAVCGAVAAYLLTR